MVEPVVFAPEVQSIQFGANFIPEGPSVRVWFALADDFTDLTGSGGLDAVLSVGPEGPVSHHVTVADAMAEIGETVVCPEPDPVVVEPVVFAPEVRSIDYGGFFTPLGPSIRVWFNNIDDAFEDLTVSGAFLDSALLPGGIGVFLPCHRVQADQFTISATGPAGPVSENLLLFALMNDHGEEVRCP